MPRTKGAKNKEKPLSFYLQKVKELGGEIPAVKTAEKAKKDIEKITKNVKSKFNLEKPKVTVTPDGENTVELSGDVIRCGNPACGKILDKEYSKCPHCGVNLTWQ